ncbi:uncharacterized protein LOC134797273 isoform X1 [Cydia splendana]|uniref:uncharacterized protein LOC134797273 isoform X1 n=1 Tax=Cydia splendana TaxID=1100963 RepID=UPI0021346016
MSIPKADKWMKVEWNSGGQSVVNARYLLKSLPNGEELKIGTVVTIGKQENGTPLTATVLASARDRELLEKPPVSETQENAGTSAQNEQEQGDYSPSASDWEPTGDSSSEDTEEEVEENKKIKLERPARQYSNKSSRKVLTPTHRPKAVIPNGMQQFALQNSMRNRRSNDMRYRSNPESNKKYVPDAKESVPELITSMKSMFQELFTIISKMKPDFNLNDITDFQQSAVEVEVPAISHDNSEFIKNEMNYTNDTQGDERMDSEYSDRSDDNVLITNRYETVDKKNAKPAKNEWVPIGSGTTLIHRDKYRKVNWKSYTVATRTLLLAAFSRRTLATHSLTGKKSPAFTNKPAKMCLDPKIVSDIVIEITDKFKVKDNLVRSIITTKCADECKMYKMQKNKHNASDKKKSKNQENIPPAANNTAS